MCGIAGVIGFDNRRVSPAVARSAIEAMTGRLSSPQRTTAQDHDAPSAPLAQAVSVCDRIGRLAPRALAQCWLWGWGLTQSDGTVQVGRGWSIDTCC